MFHLVGDVGICGGGYAYVGIEVVWGTSISSRFFCELKIVQRKHNQMPKSHLKVLTQQV